MSRDLSMDLRQAMYGQESSVVPIFLITITHDELPDPILMSTDPTERLTTDPVTYGTVSRGDDYLFTGAKFLMPSEGDDAPGTAKIVFSNVDRASIALLRSVDSPADFLVELVTDLDPDDVETTWPRLRLSKASINGDSITLDLTIDPLATEPCPAHSFNPNYAPALFKTAG